MTTDIFADETGTPRTLWGCGIGSGSTRLTELAVLVGFDVVWIDMEHASADLHTAEAMCVATQAAGGIPLVRTSGYRREHILHAVEIGARIIVVPLVNDADAAREIVHHGKFRPLGQRGYNTMSRGLLYGSDPEAMSRANQQTWLLPQIESVEAVENIDEILAVEGLGGIFIGPGDLSSDLGDPGNFDDPQLIQMVCQCIHKARAAGLHGGLFACGGRLLDAAIEAGADLCLIATDIGAVTETWRRQLAELK